MKKIVLADDVYELMKAEKSFLNRAGVRILSAGSNREALAIHRKEQADLIIARLDSSDMSGEELCAAVRNDGKLRKVSLIIVCDNREGDIERCAACRANAFMTNPVSTAVLLQEAHQLLHIASRIKTRIPMTFRMEGMSKGRSFSCEVQNISTSGMLIITDVVLYEGDELTCSVTLSGAEGIKAVGEVVRVLRKKQGPQRGYGISFTDISPDHLKRLVKFVRENCP